MQQSISRYKLSLLVLVLLTKVGLGATGSVGVFSATFDQPNTNSHFDDFKVAVR